MQTTRKNKLQRIGAILLTAALVFTMIPGDGIAYAAAKKPEKVKNVQLVSKTKTSLKVKWGKTKNAKTYQVAYKTPSAKKFTIVKVNGRVKTISNLKSGVTYQVKVRAVNQGKNGPWSKVSKFKTKTAKLPAKVTGMTLSDVTKSSAQVTWAKAKNAVSYQIAYKQAGAAKYTYAKTSKLTYKLSKLSTDTTYYVKVRAINGSKNGGWSAEQKVKTDIDVEAAKDESAVKVSATDNKIKIQIADLNLSGTGTVIRVHANDYLKDDTVSGLVEADSAGYKIGTFDMSKSKSFSFARIADNGYDKAYDKYYVVDEKGTIIRGPVFATEIEAVRNKKVEMETASKKGLVDELDEDSFEVAEDLGSNWTAMNIDFTQLILANETADGTPIDNSAKNADQIEVNGKTFYINSAYVNSLDARLARYEKMGINVVGVVVSFVETESTNQYPDALKYIDDARWTNGFNTSNELGRDYFVAGMEYIANRYSKGGSGLICNYVIGNEVDYAYDWNEIIPNKSKDGSKLPPRGTNKYLRDGEVETVAPLEIYMEEYSRTLRLANIAVKKYSSDISVGISLSKEWSKSKGEQQGATPEKNKRCDSYAPKEMLDWLNYYNKKGGDYDWTITEHNYPMDNGNAAAYETGLTGRAPSVTGDLDTSLMITQTNLEMIQVYLDKKRNLYNGKPREVYLTENGSSSGSEVGTPSMEMQREHAAYVAQYYYRAASLPSVKAIIYYKIKDRDAEGSTSFKLGLIDTTGTKKLAYNVWKYIDTDRSFEFSNPYLGSLSYLKDGTVYSVANGNVSSYYDAMSMVSSSFDWSKHWDVDAMTPVKLKADTSDTSLSVDNIEYGADEPIKVTATGRDEDKIGLYKRGETVNDEPIYSYEIGDKVGSTVLKSGKTFDIRAYGTINPNRLEDAKLPAGEYTIIMSAMGQELYAVDITITGTSEFLGAPKITTDKMTYKVGEDILVTANGSGTDWACIYRKGEVAEDGSINGAPSPIYWYYVDKEGAISGKPVILQNTTKSKNSSHPSKVLEPGEYYVILLANDGYQELARLDGIVIEPREGKDLVSVTYELDNPTDGFANGEVTVVIGEDSPADQCRLYWGDAEGKPLEGYTALNRFRLQGTTTTKRMTENTIIPPGAKTLVCYAMVSGKEEGEPVAVTLPEGAAYVLQGADTETSRFAVASDIHIALPDTLNEYGLNTNSHFKAALEDILKNHAGTTELIINGDISDNGKVGEFRETMNIWQSVENAPTMHITIGNHDWRLGNPNDMFQKYINWFNPSVDTDTLYYDEWIDGYHFIYLGSEEKGSAAFLSDKQLAWLDETLAEHAEDNQDKPVFLFCHQGLLNSVAGNFAGYWGAQWGVIQDTKLRNILGKYGQIIMFGSHTHADLDAVNNMTAGGEELPVYFNTGSVSYMWDYDSIEGSTDGTLKEGANGYFAQIFEDGTVYMFGRDFLTGEYISSAMYVLEPAKLTVENVKIGMSVGDSSINVGAATEEGMQLTYRSSNSKVATVDYNGNVRAVAPGTAKIYISTESSNTKVVNRKVVTVTVE